MLEDYPERVYAGLLGKLVGVYLGRPLEGVSYESIMAEFGEVQGYLNDHLKLPLVVTDDDIAGTLTFVRALADSGAGRQLSPAQIGEAWLNYLIEGRAVLWWGGLGRASEHTAYLRLKQGIKPPESGAIATNGPVVAQQIGAQIFIDSWALVAPGDPELAAALARRAACVSHDGEALYAAQLLAAMEALAFVERDIDRLLEVGLAQIPPGSRIARLVRELRAWHAEEPNWHRARARLAARYGYQHFPGECPVVPNHGVIILALLYGQGDFSRSLSIAVTCGWDTDCNAGNLGCLLGIRNGLAAFDEGYDWRAPVADRLYIPGADGGGAISDALTESYRLVNLGRALAGLPPLAPKGGARFHFSLPGSLQGFRFEGGDGGLSHTPRGLALRCCGVGRALSDTFIPSPALAEFCDGTYPLIASPSLYPGQTLSARVIAEADNAGAVSCALVLRAYRGAKDALVVSRGPQVQLAPGAEALLRWPLEARVGHPIAQVGIELTAPGGGTVYLDSLDWQGEPALTLKPTKGSMGRRAWVAAVDRFAESGKRFYLSQNSGRGLLIQGARSWRDYRVGVTVSSPYAEAVGLALRVQGLRRYYALLVCRDGRARLVKVLGDQTVLAEAACRWRDGGSWRLSLAAYGSALVASVDGIPLRAHDGALDGGAAALVVEAGTLSFAALQLAPQLPHRC